MAKSVSDLFQNLPISRLYTSSVNFSFLFPLTTEKVALYN